MYSEYIRRNVYASVTIRRYNNASLTFIHIHIRNGKWIVCIHYYTTVSENTVVWGFTSLPVDSCNGYGSSTGSPVETDRGKQNYYTYTKCIPCLWSMKRILGEYIYIYIYMMCNNL
jgi:hypothetical protein